VEVDASGEPVDEEVDIEVIEEIVDGLPFEIDEDEQPAMARRDSTSSGAEGAEVVSSAPLDVEAAEEDVPFESDGWEADIDAEGDATLIDSQIRVEDVLAADRRVELDLVRPARPAPKDKGPAAPREVAAPAPAPKNGSVSDAANDLGEELRELDFYLDQGFEPEARTLYRELNERFPEHPELKSRASRVPVEASS
jgi:hypothetical protein